MKKIVFIIAFLLMITSIYAQNRSATLKQTTRFATGETFKDVFFNASDTVNESETYYVEFTCKKDYPQMQDVWIDLDSISGDPSVTITVYGKKFTANSYTSLGTPVVYTGTVDTTFNYPITTANRYRFYKVEFVADATDQQTLVSDVRFKTWLTGGDLSTSALSLSGALTVGTTLTVTGESTFNNHINLGAGDDVLLSSTSDITVNTDKFTVAGATGNTVITGTLTQTGAMGAAASITLGAGADLIGSATSDITINTTAFTVAGATGNTSVGGTLGITGILTPAAGVTNPTESTHIWPVGGSVVSATAGTDAAATDGDRYWTELMIDDNVTLTGISYLVGSVGGTDSVVVQLCNSAGVEVATSRAVSGTAALVGTTAEFQSVAFTAPYAATAGVYYVTVQFNGTTAKFRTYPIPGSPFVAGSVGGTWQTKADITPGSTFTADKGPIFITY